MSTKHSAGKGSGVILPPPVVSGASGHKRKRSEISGAAASVHVTQPGKLRAVPIPTSAGSNWSQLQAKIHAAKPPSTKSTVVGTAAPSSGIASTVVTVAASAVTVSAVHSTATTSSFSHAKSISLSSVVAAGAAFTNSGAVATGDKGACGGAGATARGGAAKALSDAAMRDPARKTQVLGPFDRLLSPFESKYVAIDCEMVGVGPEGRRSVLAQVVAVDFLGRILYNKYCKSKEVVTDYRTAVSGVRPEHLRDAPDFETVQREVALLVKDRIIVGHSLRNDLHALLLGHSWKQIRDTATYKPLGYKNRAGHLKPRRLKHLCQQHLQIIIQEGEHDPAEDARAALSLYRMFQREWERSLMAPHAPNGSRKTFTETGGVVAVVPGAPGASSSELPRPEGEKPRSKYRSNRKPAAAE